MMWDRPSKRIFSELFSLAVQQGCSGGRLLGGKTRHQGGLSPSFRKHYMDRELTLVEALFQGHKLDFMDAEVMDKLF